MTKFGPWLVILCGALSLERGARAAEGDWKILIDPNNSFHFSLLSKDKAVLQAGTGGWGPNWSWFSISSSEKAAADHLGITSPFEIGGQKGTIALDVKPGRPNEAAFAYTLTAKTDVPILMIVATIGVPAGGQAKVVLTKTDGSQQTAALPVKTAEFGAVKQIRITSPAWNGAVDVALDPPLQVGGDGDLRIKLAAETLKAGSAKAQLAWTFPSAASLLMKAADVMKYAPTLTAADWFAYRPSGDVGPSAIGAEEFLDKPAGVHGGVRTRGERFVFEDGTPIRFWGTNLCYAASAPPKADAEYTAARFAKYGVNAVRMHKFSGAGLGRHRRRERLDPHDARRPRPPGLFRQPARQARRLLRLVAFVQLHHSAGRPRAGFGIR